MYLRLTFSWKWKASNLRQSKLSASYKESAAAILQSVNVIFFNLEKLKRLLKFPIPHYKTNLPIPCFPPLLAKISHPPCCSHFWKISSHLHFMGRFWSKHIFWYIKNQLNLLKKARDFMQKKQFLGEQR